MSLCEGGPVTGTAHEIMLPKVSDDECAQFWGIATTTRLCAGHSSSASLGICSVSCRPVCLSVCLSQYLSLLRCVYVALHKPRKTDVHIMEIRYLWF